jgi:hypothetical protein
MSDMFLRARVRKRDKDIQQAIKQLELEEKIGNGELADMIRDGFRKVLAEMGALGKPVKPITPDAARLVARELMNNLRERS